VQRTSRWSENRLAEIARFTGETMSVTAKTVGMKDNRRLLGLLAGLVFCALFDSADIAGSPYTTKTFALALSACGLTLFFPLTILFRNRKEALFLGTFLLLGLLSLSKAGSPLYSLDRLIFCCSCLLIFFHARNVSQKGEDVERLIRGVLICIGVAVALVVVWEYARQCFPAHRLLLPFGEGTRSFKFAITGRIGNANHTALFLIVSFLAVVTKEKKRIASFHLPLILFLFAIFATASRGALFLLPLLFAAALWRKAAQQSRWRAGKDGRKRFSTKLRALAACGLLAGVGLLFLFTAASTVSSRIRPSSFLGSELGRALSGRALLSIVSMQMSSERPILGAGPGNYLLEYTDAQGRLFKTRGFQSLHQRATLPASFAHNELLELAAEAGLPAAAAALAFLFVVLGRAKNPWRPASGRQNCTDAEHGRAARHGYLLVWIFGVLIASLWDFPLHSPPIAYLFWFGLGILTGPAVAPSSARHNVRKARQPPLLRSMASLIAIISLGATSASMVSGYYYERAIRACLAEDYERAVGEVEKALRIRPEDPKMLYTLSFALHRAGRDLEAVTPARQMVETIEALYVKGDILASLERLDEAKEAYGRVIQAYPCLLYPHFAMGKIHLMEARLDAAREEFLLVKTMKPTIDSPDARRLKKGAQQAIIALDRYTGAIDHRTET